MPTNFPTTLDTFQNPGAITLMDEGPGLYHDEQHANINDAVAALQAKVGADGSAVTSSLDYRTAANAAAIIVVAGDLASHAAGSDPHGDRAFATSAISTHSGAADPHGDRAYADAGDSALAGAVSGAFAAHVAASDPHGDRAYADAADTATLSSANGFTTSAISTHAAASDPHGDRAFATSADATVASTAAAALAAHVVAIDPHGDRAFATSAIATHNGVTTAHGISAYGASLVDDADASTARTTLGLGDSATKNVGTAAGTVMAGDDVRIAASRFRTYILTAQDLNQAATDLATFTGLPAKYFFHSFYLFDPSTTAVGSSSISLRDAAGGGGNLLKTASAAFVATSDVVGGSTEPVVKMQTAGTLYPHLNGANGSPLTCSLLLTIEDVT